MHRFSHCVLLFLLAIGASAQTANEPVLKSYEAPTYALPWFEGPVSVQFQINERGESTSVSTAESDRRLGGDVAVKFVKSWKFDLGTGDQAPGTTYTTIIEYRLIHGETDPGDGAKPTVQSNTFHFFEVTAVAPGDHLSKCPVGAKTAVPSRIKKGDFAEIMRGGGRTYLFRQGLR